MPGELRRHEGEKGRLAQDPRWGHCDVMSREGFSGGFVDSGITMDLEAKRGAVHASTTCQDGVEHNSAAILASVFTAAASIGRSFALTSCILPLSSARKGKEKRERLWQRGMW